MQRTKTKSLTIDWLYLYKLITITFLAIAFYLAGAGMVHAAVFNPQSVGDATLCSIAWTVQNRYGRGLATMGVIAVGIGAMMGKVTWTMAITIAVGISIVFSAATIANYFNAGCSGFSDGTSFLN